MHRTLPHHCLKLLPLLSALCLGLSITGPALAGERAGKGEVVRTLEDEFLAGEAAAVQVKIGVGDLSIVGWDRNEVGLEVEIRCHSGNSSECRRAADKVRYDWSRRGNRLVLSIPGTAKPRAHHLRVSARVRVPEALALETDTKVGDVTISGLRGDLEVDVGEGDVQVQLAKRHVASVEIDVGLGDAKLHVDGGLFEGTGRVFEDLLWKGNGTAKIEIDAGAGDVTVRLD